MRLRTAGIAVGMMVAAAAQAVAVPLVKAIPATDFLSSIGANSAIDTRGEKIERTIECARYLGLRWFRSGIEGDPWLDDFIRLHNVAGVRFSWSPGSGGVNLEKLITTGRRMAAAGALLAFEGPNEPNNWGVTYGGEAGGKNLSWLPVAKLQRDLYARVKSDPVLKAFPVWSITEGGAETDNVGLQFLTIPPGAGTLLPAGTKFADFANVHNYFYHPNSPGVEDNKTWNASDPGPAARVDGLYGEYGKTWAKHYQGVPEPELAKLPRVTTETGVTIGGDITEEIHGRNIVSMYLDQYRRGWSYTALYLLRDRVDEGGNQQFGFYRPDYTPRKAALYLHNLTTILTGPNALPKPASLEYGIPNAPATVHDMLLQRSDGSLALVVWGEQVKGESRVTLVLGRAVSGIRVYDVTVGVEPVALPAATASLTLTLSDHPLVVVIPAGNAAR